LIVTYWKGIFVVDKADGPDERSTLKKAGFVLHEPSICPLDKKCKACRAGVGSRYWSNMIESAARLRPFCNSLALAAMKDHLGKLAKSRATTSDIIVPAPPGLEFKPYQRAGVAYALAHKDTYFGDDMGLGKTVETIGFINCLRTTQADLNVLIVCPGTLAFNWKDELRKWIVPGKSPMPEIYIPPSSSFEVPKRSNIIVITNYEKVINDTLLGDSLKRVWDVLVCDEAQALKNWTAKRTQAVLGPEGLMQRAHRTNFLSGTPIENYPKEIWTIAAAIAPAKFGDWWEFAKRYCCLHRETTANGQSRMVDTGATHLGELQQRLRSTFMIRRLKGDVLKELPPKRRQLIFLGNSKIDWSKDADFRKWQELYEKDYEQKLAALESAKTADDYRKAVRNLEAFKGVAFEEISALRHKTAVAKLPACIEYIDQMLSTKLDKLVIFAHHQDVLEELAKHYGDSAVAIHGKTKQADREKAKIRFQDTPTEQGGARILIGGLKVAGVGLNLQAASTVVFIEIDWNPAVLTQAEDRLCRFGQKKMVHVIHLLLDGTLDVNIVKKVVAKQEVVDKALNRSPEHGLKLTGQTVMALRC
jgi:SWI/SNF-related matrix-associated actin-dependent regulator 1 of chromatin subfamily A